MGCPKGRKGRDGGKMKMDTLNRGGLVPGGIKIKHTLEKLFSQVSVVDYAAMWIIAKLIDEKEDLDRLYLNEIAEQLQIPMKEVTKIVQSLQGRGLISWTHDGDGSEGTYIQITKNGSEAVGVQQHTLKDLYARVIRRFGKERFMTMVSLVGEFDYVMNDEMERLEKE